MNAIPSDSRTPRQDVRGGRVFRDVAIITGPPARRVRDRGFSLERGEPVRLEDGWFGGTRRAKKAGRGGPGARLIAQGRVGLRSRHIALHLAIHRLLSAKTSAHQTADRLLLVSPARSGPAGTWGRPGHAPREPRPSRFRVPRLGSRCDDAKLVPERVDATASSRGESRGKGVLAA